MPPKKASSQPATVPSSTMEDDVDEIKRSLDYLTAEMSTVAKQQTTLLGLVNEVRQLKSELKEKDKIINGLERRVDDLEQYSRMEDLIISGLETKHRSYARTAAIVPGAKDGEEDLPAEEQESLESEIINFFEGKNMKIQEDSIAACHTLPRKDSKAKPAIIVRFVNRKHKTDLLRQAKKLKGTAVYINDHLTKKNAEIAREARYLWKQKKIQATWVRNCKIFIRIKGSTPEETKVVTVRELQDLHQYK